MKEVEDESTIRVEASAQEDVEMKEESGKKEEDPDKKEEEE